VSTVILKGDEAIHYAAVHDLTLNKYASDSEAERVGLSVAEANTIAGENPGLIWVETHIKINSGEPGEEA
jgi:hypothetical protein